MSSGGTTLKVPTAQSFSAISMIVYTLNVAVCVRRSSTSAVCAVRGLPPTRRDRAFVDAQHVYGQNPSSVLFCCRCLMLGASAGASAARFDSELDSRARTLSQCPDSSSDAEWRIVLS